MRNLILAAIAITVRAWKLDTYNAHLEDKEQSAITETTKVDTVVDSVLSHRLSTLRGFERYTHDQYDDDASDTGFTYPTEHAHYRPAKFIKRVPVIYHVIPKRYSSTNLQSVEDLSDLEPSVLHP